MRRENIFKFPVLFFFASFIFFISCSTDDDDNGGNGNGNGPIEGLPELITLQVTNVEQFSAKCGGLIASDGGETVTARGVCWSTGQTPTINDNITSDGAGAGNFTSLMTQLNPNTTYFVRAYATNSNGTAYGSSMSFTTESAGNMSSFTDPRDGNFYRTATIGNQEWMADNLRYLPSVSNTTSNSRTSPHYYVYDYNGTSVSDAKATDNYRDYGVLYNWTAAMNGASSSSSNPSGVQGACPDGWHLPSDDEWRELIDYLGGSFVAANKLKETGTVHWNSSGQSVTNESSFTARPGGVYSAFQEQFSEKGAHGFWWTSKEYEWDNTEVIFYQISSPLHSSVRSFLSYKDIGYSIRCVKD
ncbi:MAG: hypothetical protein LAT54_08940 [Cryomorphaceae bacterium]|nr:hypothetical protein [Cryomorphaceae bacterium]